MFQSITMSNQKKILRVLQFISYLEQKPSKSIQSIASILETTERTAYRYLDLIRDCGFNVHKDNYNRYFIESGAPSGLLFTSEEAAFLKQLVLTVGSENKLKDSILSKIYIGSDLKIVASHLLNAKNGRIVERLAEAIALKEQVYLKKYQSINSETISDRLVEPFGFTENYRSLMAFEIASQKNKTYHIDRIASIEFANKPFQHVDLHIIQKLDAFGFSESDEKFLIEKELTLKEYLLLKNEYPLTTPFIKYIPKNDNYLLKIEVNNLEPFERFLRGLKVENNSK